MKLRSSLSSLVFLATLAACGQTIETVPSTPPPSSVTAPPPAEPLPVLADSVTVDEVAIYQSVKVIVGKDGAAATKRNAPLIADRPALVRAHVKSTDRKSRALVAELTVKRAGKQDVIVRDGPKSLPALVDDSDLDTTYNFKIDAADVTPDAQMSLRMGESAEATDVVVFPADGGALALAPKSTSSTLRVKFVPVKYDKDGSGLTPDLTNTNVYRDALYNLYPTAKVEISVRAPLPWSQTITGDGQGWDELLNAIIDTRSSDRAPDDVYYVGVFTPTANLDDFCGNGGCILGVAPAADLRDVGLRVAMITGYQGSFAGGTLAQELAHAMGREHAPCGGADGPDPKYPYAGASTGVWGYNLLKDRLVDPDRYRDFLSYCDPVWVSDYTFSALFDRMDQVAKSATSPSQHGSVQSFHVGADGSVTQGPVIDVIDGPLTGESVLVRYENAAGVALSTTSGRIRRTDRANGGSMILAPHAPAAATHVRVGSLAPVGLRMPSVLR